MADTRLEIILAAKDLTDKAFGNVTGRIMALERRLLSFGSIIGGFGLGFGMASLAGHMEKTAEGFEQLEAKLDILYRGRGKQVLEEINAWALDMPINTQKAVDAWVQMKALGIEPNIERMQVLTDVATIFGDDVLGRIVLQLGQMSAKGKVMTQDLNVLAEAGINARKYIMDEFAMTVDEIQNSGVDINRVIETLFKGMERDFGGSAQRMMSSWRGLKETAASYFVEIERRVMDAGIFEAMKQSLASLNAGMKDWIATNEATIKQRLPVYVGETVKAIKSAGESVLNLVGIYRSIPDEITNAAGYGIIGRVIFGGWGPARIVAGIALINETFSAFGMGFGDLRKKAVETNQSLWDLINAIRDVATGTRDWHTGANKEWMRAADAASDYWQHQRGSAAKYQADLRNLIQNDPLNDFFGRQKNNLGYYGSPAARLIRQMSLDNEKAGEEAKAAAKKLAEELKKAQEEFKDAIMGQSRLEEYMAGGQHENAILRMEQERMARIREQGAKSREGGADADWITRHREEIGPYDADRVKAALEEIERQSQETFDGLAQLSQRTAEAMQENFSDLFFDAFTGKLKDLEDYASAIFTSIQRAAADMAGQLATEAIFGAKSVGGTGGGGGLIAWIASLFSSQAMSQTTALALVKHAGGVVGDSGPTRSIPAWMIATAPRLHNGLAPDEYPAILQRGERVLSRREASAPGMNVTINVAAPQGRIDRESMQQVQSGLYATILRSRRRNG
jgi:tape measure domain-containing protein